jgi:hypothetical protein
MVPPAKFTFPPSLGRIQKESKKERDKKQVCLSMKALFCFFLTKKCPGDSLSAFTMWNIWNTHTHSEWFKFKKDSSPKNVQETMVLLACVCFLVGLLRVRFTLLFVVAESLIIFYEALLLHNPTNSQLPMSPPFSSFQTNYKFYKSLSR